MNPELQCLIMITFSTGIAVGVLAFAALEAIMRRMGPR